MDVPISFDISETPDVVKAITKFYSKRSELLDNIEKEVEIKSKEVNTVMCELLLPDIVPPVGSASL